MSDTHSRHHDTPEIFIFGRVCHSGKIPSPVTTWYVFAPVRIPLQDLFSHNFGLTLTLPSIPAQILIAITRILIMSRMKVVQHLPILPLA